MLAEIERKLGLLPTISNKEVELIRMARGGILHLRDNANASLQETDELGKARRSISVAEAMGRVSAGAISLTDKCVSLTDTPFFQLREEKFEFGPQTIYENGDFKNAIGLWYVRGHEIDRVTPNLINNLHANGSRALKQMAKQTPDQFAQRYILAIDRLLR